MAQAGFTPISLYYSTTAAATPSAGNLVAGELALNTVDEKLYFKNSAGTVKLLASNATSAPVVSFSAGTTGFTPSTATSGAVTLAGTLATTNGGTGLTSFTSGGVVYASSSSALATGSALTFDGTNLGVGSGAAINFGGSLVLYGDSTLTALRGRATNGILFQDSSGTTTMTLANAGNLGLGVTPSTWSTGKAFEIGATGNGIWNVDNNNIAFTQNAYFNTTWRYARTQAASFYDQNQGVHRWFNAASGTAGNAITFTQAMTLDASGNLGVGTTSPATKFEVNTAVGATQNIATIRSANVQLKIGTTDVGNGEVFYNIFPTSSSSTAGAHIWQGGGTERARIDNNGTFVIKNDYQEQTYTANSSTAITLNITANGTDQVITLTGTATITMPAAVAGKSFLLKLKTGSGGYTVTWSTVKWPGGTAPTLTSTASRMDIFSFFSDGTNWYGCTVGQNYTP